MTMPGAVREDIQLGSLILNTVDDRGCTWIVNDLDGWWNLPEPDLPDDPRAFDHDGSYVTAGRYKARDVTLSGAIIPVASDIGAVADARRRLLSAVSAIRSSIDLVVYEPDAAKTASMRLSGRPQIGIANTNGVLIFQIPLRSADPRKYSTASTDLLTFVSQTDGGRTYDLVFPREYPLSLGSTGIVSVVNAGDYNTSGVLAVTGPAINPRIENIQTGDSLQFNITLASTDTLTIDLYTHSVLLNNQASRRSTLSTDSKWFSLAPGQTDLRFTASSTTTAYMMVTYRSAWIS